MDSQISLAVAALAVHVSIEDWGDGGVVNWLKEEMNSHPECIPSFLELLKVLPEVYLSLPCFSPPGYYFRFSSFLFACFLHVFNH